VLVVLIIVVELNLHFIFAVARENTLRDIVQLEFECRLACLGRVHLQTGIIQHDVSKVATITGRLALLA